MNREPNTQYIASLSYGKDSIAMLEAIHQLGWPLDRIVHAEVWATDDIPADLPPMVEFKEYADRIIQQRYGIRVEHICAMRKVTVPEGGGRERERESTDDGESHSQRLTYERLLYRGVEKQSPEYEWRIGQPRGFPRVHGPWCLRDLKLRALNSIRKGDIREVVLPCSGQTEEIGVSRERERERERDYCRIPAYRNAERWTGMVPRAQACRPAVAEQSTNQWVPIHVIQQMQEP